MFDPYTGQPLNPAAQPEATLAEKVGVLERELNLPAGAPLAEKVEKALETLGLADELRGQPLTRKVDVALETLGVTAQTNSVPMGAPVSMGTPVPMTAPVPMVVEARVVQEVVEAAPPPRPVTTNVLKLSLRDGRGLALHREDCDATHGRRAFHIRMTHASEAIEVEFTHQGNVKVVSGHHTTGYCLDNWHGRHNVGNRQHFSTWYRTHGHHAALRFIFNNGEGTISPIEAQHLVLGWGAHSELVPRGDRRQMQFVVPPGVTIVNGGGSLQAIAGNLQAAIVQAVRGPGSMQMDRGGNAHAIGGRAGPLRLTLVSHPGRALSREGDCCLLMPPPVFICCLSGLKLGGEHEALTVHYHPGTGLLNRPECCDQRIHNSWANNTSENEVLSFRCGVFPCPDHESWQFYSDGTIHNRHAPHLVLGIRDYDGKCILVPQHDTTRRMVFREVISASG